MHVPSVRSFLRFTSALVFAAGFATDASAAGDVAGRVVDPDGRPVAGARVLLSGAGVPLQSAITTEDGRFSIAAPETGRLTIRVAADGFRAEAVNVDGSAEPKDVGTIALAISALSESIVVSASQVEIPLTRVTSSVTIISGAELEARQIHTVADALRMVPGLTLASTGGLGTTTGVFPRGGESNFTLALIDGVPANSFGGDFDFSQVPTANIERIEVVRGPQSALFGANAIGAVVQIVSRRGGPPAAKLSVEGGHYGTSRVTTSTTGQHRGFEWGASYDGLGSDGFNGERTASGEEVVNDDYERHAGAASGGWREGNFWVRADARHSTDERGFPGPFGSNPIGIYGGIDAVSRGTNDRTQASVSTSVPLSNRVRAQGLVGYNRLESDFTSQFDTSESFSRRWVGRMQADTALHSGLDLSAGVELQGERAGSTYITGSSFQQIPVERSTAGYFGEARWNWQDRVFVVTGLRIEDIRRDRIEESGTRPVLPSDTVVSVNPRASAAWITRGNTATYTKVRGAIGTGIRPPDGFELAFTDNPELRPERSFSVEAGVDQAFASGTWTGRGNRLLQRVRRPHRGGRFVQRIEPVSNRQHLERTRARAGARADAARPDSRAAANRSVGTRRLHPPRHEDPRGRSGRRRAAAVYGRAGAAAASRSSVFRRLLGVGCERVGLPPRRRPQRGARRRAVVRHLWRAVRRERLPGLARGRGVARRAIRRGVRPRGEPVRSVVRRSVRLPRTRPPRNRGSSPCCRPLISSSATATARSSRACRSMCRLARSSA